jgi:prepilin-type N-terminal cleavage/methylation domain-containing protein
MLTQRQPAWRAQAPHRGVTLVELLVTMIIVAALGTAFARMMIVESRFFDGQAQAREARTVSRGALSLMVSDLRMVESSAGLLAAAPKSISARIPYVFGVFCGTTGASSTLSMAPTDSLTLAQSGFSGYAWRSPAGAYTYVEAGVPTASAVATPCTAASITTLTGGKTVSVSPALPAGTAVGSLVFLFRRVRYDFKASAVLPGRTALWRTTLTNNVAEEIVAPFDTSAGFRFYVGAATAPVTPAPALLSSISGLELRLNGQSERAARGATHVRTAQYSTAVFFMNRP